MSSVLEKMEGSFSFYELSVAEQIAVITNFIADDLPRIWKEWDKGRDITSEATARAITLNEKGRSGKFRN